MTIRSEMSPQQRMISRMERTRIQGERIIRGLRAKTDETAILEAIRPTASVLVDEADRQKDPEYTRDTRHRLAEYLADLRLSRIRARRASQQRALDKVLG